MQISEISKAIGPLASDGQNVSSLIKTNSSFAKLLKTLNTSLEKPLDPSDQSLLEGIEELLADDPNEEDLLELMAMMGQNTLVAPAMASFKNLDQAGQVGVNDLSQMMAEPKLLTKPDQMINDLVRPLQGVKLDTNLGLDQSLVTDQKNGFLVEPIFKQVEVLSSDKGQQKDGGLATENPMLGQDGRAIKQGLGVKDGLDVKETLDVKEDSASIMQKNAVASASTKLDQAGQIVASEPKIETKTDQKTELKTSPSLEATTMAGMAKTSPLEALAISQGAPDVPLVKQVEGKILEQFDGKTGKVFKMTLKPDHLGEIDVELKINNGKLVIGILSASQETHELLTRQVDQLIRGLALQKIQVQTIETHRVVEEADQAQGQTNFATSDFNQNNAQNPYFKGNQKSYQRHFGNMQQGESISDSLIQLSSMSKQFNRLDYRI